MSSPDAAQLWPAFLAEQRWFAGKGRQITDVQLFPRAWITAAGHWPAVRGEDLSVSYAEGEGEHYQLLSAYWPADSSDPATTGNGPVVELPELGRVRISDATADPEAFEVFLASLELPATIQRFRPQRFTGEQSNTNVRIGPRAMVKLFRRPEHQPNREAELLARLSHTAVTPQLFKTVVVDDRVLAIVVEFIEAAEDGWTLATTACREQRDFTAQAAALGSALRVVHNQLAQPVPGQDECPDLPGERLRAAMITRLERAAAQFPPVAPLVPGLRQVFDAVGGDPISTQPVHGDFHLGQALYRPEPPGWVIIDFEGEPLKTREERFQPDSPWRDVAGALRSFAYAAGVQPEAQLAAARSWQQRCRVAFLAGYCGTDSVPTPLLRAYELDKAIYEIGYELRNRPQWAAVPLRTVQDELNGLRPGSPTRIEEH